MASRKHGKNKGGHHARPRHSKAATKKKRARPRKLVSIASLVRFEKRFEKKIEAHFRAPLAPSAVWFGFDFTFPQSSALKGPVLDEADPLNWCHMHGAVARFEPTLVVLKRGGMVTVGSHLHEAVRKMQARIK